MPVPVGDQGSPAPAWTQADLAQNPHTQPEKAGKVLKMFDAIAPSYDLNNRLHSLWQDVRWRNFAVKQANVKPGDIVLDVACGTGDLTQAFAKTHASRVTGLDFTSAMLRVAEQKQQRIRPEHAAKITYVEADAMALPLADASVDIVSIAFGIRNVSDAGKALQEFRRVLKPGGRLVILEFGTPTFAPIRWFNDFYCGQVMPRTATLISGDRSGAYKYLPKSVSTFIPRAEMCRRLSDLGLVDVQTWSLSFGICLCYRAIKL